MLWQRDCLLIKDDVVRHQCCNLHECNNLIKSWQGNLLMKNSNVTHSNNFKKNFLQNFTQIFQNLERPSRICVAVFYDWQVKIVDKAMFFLNHH